MGMERIDYSHISHYQKENLLEIWIGELQKKGGKEIRGAPESRLFLLSGVAFFKFIRRIVIRINFKFMDDKKDKKPKEEKSVKKEEKKEEAKKTLEQELAELKDKYLRALAEMQNLQKRQAKEKEEFSKFSNAMLILELLPILDNYERAKLFMSEEDKKNEKIKGLMHTFDILEGVLERQGIKPIEIKAGEKVNTSFHEVLLTSPGEKDVILEELEKGYILHGRVLKPAKVKIGNGEKV